MIYYPTARSLGSDVRKMTLRANKLACVISALVRLPPISATEIVSSYGPYAYGAHWVREGNTLFHYPALYSLT